MKNKKGFISTSIVYAFFLVFILIMIATIMSFANKRFLIKKIESDCEYPGEDIIISCQDGDKLSDCLFIAEHKEAENLWEKVKQDGVGVLNATEKKQWDAIARFSTRAGIIDLSLSKEEIIDRIKGRVALVSGWDYDSKYEIGMYQYFDDLGYTYYFRGAEDDNFVLFADKLWSIVRINGDGSIRLIYQGEWDKISSLTDINAKKYYIKNYSYIDMDSNGEKTSNDARHYNVNNTGEALGGWDHYMYLFNQELIVKYCNDKNTQISNSLKTFIETISCNVLKSYGEAKLQKTLNYGNSEYSGSVKLYNAGYMSNSKNAWGDTNAKLSNAAPSTIMNILNAWYYTYILGSEYENLISKESLFCANKDVVMKENSDYFLDDEYCYCYGNTVGNEGWKNNITRLEDGLFNYCSNAVGNGQCAANEYGNGLQLNYHLASSKTTIRGGADLRCLNLNNSSFSFNMQNTTKIEYPIGLLTASEINLAAGSYREENSNSYLSTSYNYWTGDLAFGNNNTVYDLNTYYFAYIGNKNMADSTLNTKNYVLDVLGDKNYVAHIKPVINLKANVKYKNGNGSIEAPYEIGE